MPPTAEHEALHRVFRQDEALFTRAMARVFNITVTPPEPGGVTVLNTDLTEIEPLERRPDSVLLVEFLVHDPAGKYILVIEAQTEPEPARRRRWPHYIAHLHDKYGCPVILAVVCSKKRTARWAAVPIEIGVPDLICQTTRLVVFGPENVPAITDPAEASADLMLTVFSALTHSRGKAASGILEALAIALSTIEEDAAANLAEFTETGLGRTAGAQKWKDMMATLNYPYASELRLKGREEGREQGREEARVTTLAMAIFTVLKHRGIAVGESDRARIQDCRDAETLDAWLGSAATATKASDLFE